MEAGVDSLAATELSGRLRDTFQGVELSSTVFFDQPTSRAVAAYLLEQMGYEVDDTAYFLVCNADREADGFNGEMKFQEVLIPYKWNSNWIHEKVTKMVDLMNNTSLPRANPSCKNCAYAKRRAELESL